MEMNAKNTSRYTVPQHRIAHFKTPKATSKRSGFFCSVNLGNGFYFLGMYTSVAEPRWISAARAMDSDSEGWG